MKDLSLHYDVCDFYGCEDTNRKNYAEIKEFLYQVGISLNIKDGHMHLHINEQAYKKNKKRNAGRKHRFVYSNDNFSVYKYADIVFMMQSMTDKEICEKINLPQATYYRHKKEMRESTYYKSLDLNRLKDLEYLQSVSGNCIF